MAADLHPGERVLFKGHPSWRSMLGFHLQGLLIAAALGALARLAGGFGADDTFLVVLAALAGTVAVGLLRRLATTYTITDRRLNIRRGILSREIQETRLERVQNVNCRQTVLERLMRVGDVDFDTASTGDDYSFVFAGVAEPRRVVHQVDAATGLSREASGAAAE